MNRRGFLGSLLGTVATSTPFFARLMNEPAQRIIIPEWRMGIWLADGTVLQAPGIKELVKHQRGYEWIAEPLLAQNTFVARGVHLFDKNGVLVKQQRFSCDVPMVSGDTLKCQYLLTVDEDQMHLPEAKRALSSPHDMAQAFIARRTTRA